MNKQVVDTYKIMHVINQSINPPRDALVKVVVLVENWNNPTAFVYQSFFTKFGSYVVDDIKIAYKLWNIEKIILSMIYINFYFLAYAKISENWQLTRVMLTISFDLQLSAWNILKYLYMKGDWVYQT